MWAEIVKKAATFESGVLSGIDAEGYPCSVRCAPVPDDGAQILRCEVSVGIELRPGPASLLCHSHNEQLWDLRSLNVRGTLERDAQGWFLRPTAIIPEMAATNPIGMIRAVVQLRRTAANYLKKRNLPAPAIPWKELVAAKEEAIARGRAAASSSRSGNRSIGGLR
ncbi:MAG: hypothetical protein U0841_11605 [Chloroflexia bacterium]